MEAKIKKIDGKTKIEFEDYMGEIIIDGSRAKDFSYMSPEAAHKILLKYLLADNIDLLEERKKLYQELYEQAIEEAYNELGNFNPPEIKFSKDHESKYQMFFDTHDNKIFITELGLLRKFDNEYIKRNLLHELAHAFHFQKNPTIKKMLKKFYISEYEELAEGPIYFIEGFAEWFKNKNDKERFERYKNFHISEENKLKDIESIYNNPPYFGELVFSLIEAIYGKDYVLNLALGDVLNRQQLKLKYNEACQKLDWKTIDFKEKPKYKLLLDAWKTSSDHDQNEIYPALEKIQGLIDDLSKQKIKPFIIQYGYEQNIAEMLENSVYDYVIMDRNQEICNSYPKTVPAYINLLLDYIYLENANILILIDDLPSLIDPKEIEECISIFDLRNLLNKSKKQE